MDWLQSVFTGCQSNLYAVKNSDWPHVPEMEDLLGGSPFFVTLQAEQEARDGFYPQWDQPAETEAYLKAWIHRYL